MRNNVTMPATCYFDQGDLRKEAETLKDQVIVSKYKCRAKGYMEYGEHYYMVTTSFDIKFVVAKKIHQVVKVN